MRKSFTLITCMALAFTVFGQRTVDWAVEDILTSEVQSNTTQGSIFDIEAVFKNLGTDSVLSGDTITFQFAMLNTNDQAIIALPQNGLGIAATTRELGPNDTMHFHLRFTFNRYPISSQDIKLRMASAIFSRGSNGVAAEGTATQANNVFIKNGIWRNPQGWGVSVQDVELTGMNIAPNPANTSTTVTLDVVNVSENTLVNLFNIHGQLVRSVNVEPGQSSFKLNTSELTPGFYFLKVKNGLLRSEQKLQVLR